MLDSQAHHHNDILEPRMLDRHLGMCHGHALPSSGVVNSIM
jgi:hypothetical protein